MKLNRNSTDGGLSFFKAIKVEVYLNGIDLKAYHFALVGTVGVEGIFLTSWRGEVMPKVLTRGETLRKLIKELEEDKSKTKNGG
jgi:hypothetical protein